MQAAMKRPMPLCFNGAMTFQSWKGGSPDGLIMNIQSSFNGAMTFQSWKGHFGSGNDLYSQRFNGAMTFQSWKG